MNPMIRATQEAVDSGTGESTSQIPALGMGADQSLGLGFKRTLVERIKGLLCKLKEALQGDHEFHKYLGM